MGDCYTVRIDGKVSNEVELYKELRDFVEKKHPKFVDDLFYQTVDFSLKDYEEDGATVKDIRGVMRIIFGGWHYQYAFVDCKGIFCYESDFNATYSWCRVIKWAMEIIAKHMTECKHLNCEDGSGWSVKDGELKIGEAA